jgi:hypothetical protein
MPKVRFTGDGDLVVRYAGRRLRVGGEFTEVSDDALEKLRAEGGENLEVEGAPTQEQDASDSGDQPSDAGSDQAGGDDDQDVPASTGKRGRKGAK